MFQPDVNLSYFEGTILDISLVEYNGTPFLNISLLNKPFQGDKSDCFFTIHLYATKSYAKFLHSQLSPNDRVYVHALYCPSTDKSIIYNWFRIQKLFITQKFYGLTLKSESPSEQ